MCVEVLSTLTDLKTSDEVKPWLVRLITRGVGWLLPRAAQALHEWRYIKAKVYVGGADIVASEPMAQLWEIPMVVPRGLPGERFRVSILARL